MNRQRRDYGEATPQFPEKPVEVPRLPENVKMKEPKPKRT